MVFHLQEWLSNNLQSQLQIQAIEVVKNKTRVKVDSKIMFFQFHQTLRISHRFSSP
ncbi:hypothetical protein [uncultured Helicobacter sp.]|uniref:hypothetical protein n=1 Tax=uncultured Helicobacter sp. TaxID=175537 RepID=UPI00374F07BC